MAEDIELGSTAAPSQATAIVDEESGQTSDEKREPDPFLVGWDGPDDPANPRNWNMRFRMVHVILVSCFALYANLAATMYSPGALQLEEEFHITNTYVASLTVTIYILGFAVGPLFLSPLSELYGRQPMYHAANIFYLAFTLGCAFAKNTAEFLVFRFIAGCAASIPLTIGGGTIADLIPEEGRGRAMAMFGMGPLLGPVTGPIMGGFMTEAIGWRWTFRLISILAGIFTVIDAVVMRETFADVILDRKAARLRKETGEPSYRSPREVKGFSPRQLLVASILRPTKMLIFSPLVLLLSLYCAFVFGLLFLLFTTFPAVFEDYYGWGVGVSGLSYLGLGIGMIFGLVGFAVLSDKLLKKSQEKGEGTRPEARLPLMMWVPAVVPIGFFWYGWSAQAGTHWIVPILGTSIIGLGMFFIIMPAQLYLIDAFGQERAASALAANTILRNLCGTFLPLAASPLYAKLDFGWGNSLLGFIGLVFVPVPFLFYKYGETLRKKFPVDF